MPTQNDLEQRMIQVAQDYPEIAERIRAGDPEVTIQLRSMAAFLADVAKDVEVATIEPFLKSTDRTILADATNKGILPIATPCQHIITIKNNGTATVSLSTGRVIEDSSGRPWRMLSGATVLAGQTVEATVEQSSQRSITYDVPYTDTFHQVILDISPDLYLSAILIKDNSKPVNTFTRKPRWMNVAKGEAAVVLKTDSMQRITVEFGDSDRAGLTVKAGQKIFFTLTESFGAVDVTKLKEASLQNIVNTPEQRLTIRFKATGNGLIRAGADPHDIASLRLLASYPALYGENAVFLGNFDYLVRNKFMPRANFIAVWNETIQEKYYGVNISDINHLFIAVNAKNNGELTSLQNDIAALIGNANSLYEGRVKRVAVVERPYKLTINCRLSPVHNADTVKAEIINLLTSKYGKGTVAASRWLADAFNGQEISTLLRQNISAFQDRISDFTLLGEDLSKTPVKPHQWLYLAASGITVNISQTSESGEALWAL